MASTKINRQPCVFLYVLKLKIKKHNSKIFLLKAHII